MITTCFMILGFIAIATGGSIAAFSAHHPSRVASWVSAYLVLVVGLLQFGLVWGWHVIHPAESAVLLLALLFFMIGNGLVIGGTIAKEHTRLYLYIVQGGGVGLALSMVTFFYMLRSVPFSLGVLLFLIPLLIICISMPIGLMLSARRAKDLSP